MDIRPIHTEADYDWALAQVARYFTDPPEVGSPEGDRFTVLSDLIEAYEAKHWAIDAPDPIAAILYRMELSGKTRKDLAELLGSQSRATEVLKRKRPLTLSMIYKINHEWGVPAESLITPYHVEKVA
jgi:HTH-type transcriptional regulator/antitoxin HigA